MKAMSRTQRKRSMPFGRRSQSFRRWFISYGKRFISFQRLSPPFGRRFICHFRRPAKAFRWCQTAHIDFGRMRRASTVVTCPLCYGLKCRNVASFVSQGLATLSSVCTAVLRATDKVEEEWSPQSVESSTSQIFATVCSS